MKWWQVEIHKDNYLYDLLIVGDLESLKKIRCFLDSDTGDEILGKGIFGCAIIVHETYGPFYDYRGLVKKRKPNRSERSMLQRERRDLIKKIEEKI